MKIFFLLSQFVFLSIFCSAQRIVSLEECIQAAHANNIEVRQSLIAKEMSEKYLTQSKAAFIPTLNGSANQNYNLGRTIDPFTNQFTTNQVSSRNVALVSSLTLFNGFQAQNSIRQADYAVQAAAYDIEFTKNTTALGITALYLQILFDEELIALAENQANLTMQEISRMRKLIDAGKISAVELPDLESQLANEKGKMLFSQNQMKTNYVRLSALLNSDPEEQLKLSRPAHIAVTDTSELEAAKIYSLAVQLQPQVKSAELKKQGAIRSYAVAKGSRSPRLSINASLSTLYASSSMRVAGYRNDGTVVVGYTASNEPVYAQVTNPVWEKNPLSNQFKENLNKFYGFNLAIPLVNNYQVSTAIARQKLSVQSAELNVEQTKKNLHRTIVNAHIDATNARNRIASANAAVSAAEQGLRNAEKRMEVGQITSLEYAQVKSRLTQSSSDLLQATYDYIFKTKILEFYSGQPLKL